MSPTSAGVPRTLQRARQRRGARFADRRASVRGMVDDVATGLALLDMAHENASLRGALILLLHYADENGFYCPDEASERARMVAHEVLQRFGAEPLTGPTSPKHRQP